MITPAHAFFNWAFLRKWLPPWWVVGGSVLPDVPAFMAFFYLLAVRGINAPEAGGFFGFAMANGNPNRQPGFMEASFLLHALPLLAALTLLAVFWRRRWLFAVLAGWGLHVVADFLTHVEDAYAPLYPFLAGWRVPGPISYWNPEHGADTFWVIQSIGVALVLAWLFTERLLAGRKARTRRGGVGR